MAHSGSVIPLPSGHLVRLLVRVCYSYKGERDMRVPKPFWNSQKKCFYVQIGKKQHRLAKEKNAAWTRYYELMARSQRITENGFDATIQHVITHPADRGPRAIGSSRTDEELTQRSRSSAEEAQSDSGQSLATSGLLLATKLPKNVP